MTSKIDQGRGHDSEEEWKIHILSCMLEEVEELTIVISKFGNINYNKN